MTQEHGTKGLLGTRVHLSTLCLATVGLFDLVTSLLWLHNGFGEGNPLFSALAEHGSLAFALGKILFLAGPILILEFVRKRKPFSAEVGTWVAFVLYAGLYASHLASIA